MAKNRQQALLVLAFPIVLAVGIFLIPVVPDYADHAQATEAVGQTARWFAGHLTAAIAFALGIVAVQAVNDVLHKEGHGLPMLTIPILAIGAGLYAAGLGADGIGPIAVQAAGASPTLFFDGSGWFVSGTFMAATLFFGAGLISLVIHANRSELLTGAWRWLVFVAALAFMVIPAIPSGWGLYGEALAAFGVFGPLAAAIWVQKGPSVGW
jgi:hypothetical protein